MALYLSFTICVCLCVALCVCTRVMCVFFCQVVVSVGRLLSYTPGSISLVTSTVVPFPISGVAGGVAGGGVGLIFLLVLVVAIIVVVYRRDSVKKRQQVSALMVQMETLETNMAEECKRGMAYVL